MPKLIFARPLDPHERAVLETLMEGDNETVKQRALIVLLSSQEQYRIPEIAPMVGLHVDKVRKWVLRFNDQGMQGLQPTRRSRPGGVDPPLRRIWRLPAPRVWGCCAPGLLDALRDVCRRSLVDEISRESLRRICCGSVSQQANRCARGCHAGCANGNHQSSRATVDHPLYRTAKPRICAMSVVDRTTGIPVPLWTGHHQAMDALVTITSMASHRSGRRHADDVGHNLGRAGTDPDRRG